MQIQLASICRAHKCDIYNAARYYRQEHLKKAYKFWKVVEDKFNKETDLVTNIIQREKALTQRLHQFTPNTKEWNLCKQEIINLANTPVSINMKEMKLAQYALKKAQEDMQEQNIETLINNTFKDGYFPEVWKGCSHIR
jgi:DNA repair ATPase RecN